jgi:hypothetical protein
MKMVEKIKLPSIIIFWQQHFEKGLTTITSEKNMIASQVVVLILHRRSMLTPNSLVGTLSANSRRV